MIGLTMMIGPLTASVLLLLLCNILSVADAAGYVLTVSQQLISGQPYPRGLSSQLLAVTIGNVTYQQTIDSGSSLLSVPCNSARAQLI